MNFKVIAFDQVEIKALTCVCNITKNNRKDDNLFFFYSAKSIFAFHVSHYGAYVMESYFQAEIHGYCTIYCTSMWKYLIAMIWSILFSAGLLVPQMHFVNVCK